MAESEQRPVPHEILWLTDGNVILATETRLYRVHKSILALQSSFFKGLFDLPTPMESNDPGGYMDGLQVVRMVGDKDEEVEILVKTIFDPGYVKELVHRITTRQITYLFYENVVLYNLSPRQLFPTRLRSYASPQNMTSDISFSKSFDSFKRSIPIDLRNTAVVELRGRKSS